MTRQHTPTTIGIGRHRVSVFESSTDNGRLWHSTLFSRVCLEEQEQAHNSDRRSDENLAGSVQLAELTRDHITSEQKN